LAKIFQSRSLRSSPGTYLRCSLNSTEKPWNGLACNPARKPSTMNLARRSSRDTWRMTSGRRYFSVLMRDSGAAPQSLLYQRQFSAQHGKTSASSCAPPFFAVFLSEGMNGSPSKSKHQSSKEVEHDHGLDVCCVSGGERGLDGVGGP